MYDRSYFYFRYIVFHLSPWPPLFQIRPPTCIMCYASYIPQGFTVATDCIHQIKPERSLLVWFNPKNKKNQKELEDQVFLWIKHQDDCVLFISRIVRWGHCSSDRRPETNFTIYSLPEKRRKGLWCLISMVERTVFLVRCNFALLLSSWTIRDVNILQPTTKIIIRK